MRYGLAGAVGAVVPVRRKVFRIEERGRACAPPGRSAREEELPSPQQLARELRELRALIATQALPQSRPGVADDSRLGEELDAVVSSTETATIAVLKAAEAIERAAGMLVAALNSDHDRALAADIREQVARIFDACNFQDLAGQRIDKVKRTLSGIDARSNRLLNGPGLPGDADRIGQHEVDRILDF